MFRWRTSSFSGGNGQCVELGRTWRKSSFSGGNGECVELGAAWRTSSFSGGNGACVELSDLGAVRDSKNPGGPILSVDLGVLVGVVKAGQFDR